MISISVLVVLIIAIIWMVSGGERAVESQALLRKDSGQVQLEMSNPPTSDVSAAPTSTIASERFDLWVSISLITMALATLISTVITFYLYYWRRILLSTPNLIVPEEWGKYLKSVGRSVEVLNDELNKNIHHIAERTAVGTNKIDNMIDTFMALQKALDEKDVEIRRFKKNYDAAVFRKFLRRFIRVGQTVDDFIQSETVSADYLPQVKRLLDDAFDECGVESFSPNIGDDYRKSKGIADNPKTTKANNPEDEFKIAAILQVGYRFRGSIENEPIVPAKVKIFKTE